MWGDSMKVYIKHKVLVVILLILTAVLFYVFVWDKPKFNADVKTKVFNSSMCQRVGDDYYYISGKSVKCFSGGDEKTVYEGKKPYMICADKEYLYVCDNGILSVELKSGKSTVIVNDEKNNVYNLFTDNGCLFYKITNEPLKCLDVKTDEAKDAIELLNDKSDGFHKQRFSDDKWIIARVKDGELGAFEICDDDMNLLFSNATGFVEKDNEFLLAAVSDFNCGYECRFYKSDGTEAKTVKYTTPAETTGESTIIGNNVVTVSTTIKQPMFKGGDINYTPELENHYYDTYIKVNTDDFEIQAHKTRKFERIIYADDKKVMTYYNGKYLTYSADDWKVTDEKKADGIKNGGRYTFKACGEYVFVFDDNTGECISKIEI